MWLLHHRRGDERALQIASQSTQAITRAIRARELLQTQTPEQPERMT